MPTSPNPYLDLMQTEEVQRQSQQAATLSSAVDVNPDQYATQKKVASYLGYAPAVVDATPEQSKREAQVKQVQADTANAPALARRYTADDFAKLAHDDSGVLSQIESHIAGAARYVMGANAGRPTLLGDVRGGVNDASKGAAGLFRALFDVVAPVLDPLENVPSVGGNPLRRMAEGFAERARTPALDAEKITQPVSLVQAGVSSGVRSAVGNALMLPAALLGPAGEAAALTGMSAQAGGQAYQDAKEQGLSTAKALPFAASQAVIEFATEKIPMHRLVGDLAANTNVVKMVARQIGAEVPGEQIATILQDMNEWAVLPANQAKTFKDYLVERPSAAAQTLIATIVGTGGNVALMKGVQSAVDQLTGYQRQVTEADIGVEQLQKMLQLAAQSKLRERSPETFAALVQEVADGAENAPSEVWVDARTLVGETGEGGLLNQEQVRTALPSVLPQLEEALQTGGAVAIPIGEFTANVAGTPLEQKLLEHLRMDVGGLSQFEAKQAASMAEQFLQSSADKVVAGAADAAAMQNSAETVKAAIVSQLATANRFTPEVNEAYASLVRDFYTTMAGRLGMMPDQMYQAYPLRVAAAGTGPMAQSAYHGTHARGIERFSTAKIGTGEGAQVYGWGLYFAGNAQVAEFYRKTVSEARAADDHDYFNAAMNLSLRLENLDAFVGAGRSMSDKEMLDFARAHIPDAPETKAMEKAIEEVGTGQLYHVEVPNDDQLLDRDAAISDQPEAVRAALEKLGFDTSKGYVVTGPHGDVQFTSKEKAQRYIREKNLNAAIREAKRSWQDGADAYRRLAADMGSDEAASKALAAAGIPGLRYLDQNSRGVLAGAKTYNYVIFQDDAVQKVGEFYQSRVKQATPAVTKLLKNLTPEEQAKVTDKVAEKVLAQLSALPSAKEMAAIAYAGRAKRGWYAKSAETILNVFGADGPRFAALLAAMSPQTSVENNLFNTLSTWKNWVAAGRPQERNAIVQVMGRSVMGSNLTDSVLPAWINNSVRALTHEDPGTLLLSGPKVNSFFRNLVGHVNEVTNDAWMANFSLVSQTIFKGGLNKAGTDPGKGKGTGYLAMNARVREAAKELTKLTGDLWTPAEVQETVWSWAKTLYELSASATEERSARQIVEEGGLTDDLINATPDFGTLFHDPQYANILKEAGYGRELDDVAQRLAAQQAEQGPGARGQAAPFAPEAQRRYELAAARRLERLAEQRGNAREANAEQDLEDAVAEANAEAQLYQSQPQRPGSPLHEAEPLRGMPTEIKVDGETITFGPYLPARAAAAAYMARAGLPYTPPTTYAKVDKERAGRIARAYARMVDDPTDPKVKASYAAMISETLAQYEAILATGLKVEFIEGDDPYGNPRHAILDVIHNNHLFVFPTEQGFGSATTLNIGLATNDGTGITAEQALAALGQHGKVRRHAVHQSKTETTLVVELAHELPGDVVHALSAELKQEAIAQWSNGKGELHGPNADGWRPFNSDFFLTIDGTPQSAQQPSNSPMLQPTQFTDANGKPMLANDVFRVVHDYFGHIKEGTGFRADGEENAWRQHLAMFSEAARPAVTTETRGQNSWVNFGPHAVANATADPGATVYADQKTGLLPSWVVTEGATDGSDRRAGDGTAAADGGRGGPATVLRGENGRVEVQGVHYSTQQRAILNGRLYGTGLKGAERERIAQSDDGRLKTRVYLYVDEGNGIRPEAGVGGVAHNVTAPNLYDINANPLKLPTADQNAMESAILDAGFDGYYVPKVFNNQGVAVIIGDAAQSVPVNVPEMAQGTRGSFSPKSLTISLLEHADLSTFLHETGHFFLEVMTDIASQPTVPAAVANDTAAVLKWFGIKAGDNKTALDTWRGMSLEEQRPFHEKFAESFEQYLFEGKAPNQELQPLFAKVRAWMTSVYRSLKDFLAAHDTQLTPTVRGVFDRLLASDQAIAEAEQARAYAPLFKSAEEAGMTPEEWAAYQAVGQQATERAITQLEGRSLRDMRWASGARARALREAKKATESKRKAVETETRAELEAQPVELARGELKELRKAEAKQSAKHKDAYKAWGERYDDAKAKVKEEVRADRTFTSSDERSLEVQRRMLNWEKDHPAPTPDVAQGDLEAIATRHGFGSADELARALKTAPTVDEMLPGIVDRKLLERFGDLTTVDGMQRAADEAVHNEARSRFIATGLAALQTGARQTAAEPGRKTPVNVITKAARQYAEALIARRKIRDLKPAQYLAAETRAGKLALQATASGDTQLAITATRDQLLNHHAARQAQAAQADIEKRIAYLRKLENGTLPAEYQEQIDTLLDRFDLRETPLKAIDKRKSLMQWVESQRAIGIEPELPEGLLDEAMRKNYRDMTVEEFRGLVDTVKQIEHLARLKNKLLTAKDQREFEAVRDEIAKSITDNAGDRDADTRTPTTNLGRALQAMRNFGAAHIKAATLARILDGGKDGGPVWEYFVRAANERGDFETTERAKATKELSAILAPWMNSGKLGGAGKYFATVNRSFNRESLLTIALNTGNEGNLQRLLGGEGWTQSQLEPLLATLSRADWETVQRVWDYFDSFRPRIGEKQMRVYGAEPDWVEAAPREQQLPDGTTLKLKGGYYPIKYDPAASVRAEEHADAEGARRQLQGAYSAATTRRSFTKTRAEEVTGRPLLYTLAGVYSGVNDVIHDLAWHEWLIDTNRLLKSTAIDSAIREHYGPAAVRQLKTWRDAIAEGDGHAQEALDMALGRLRQGVSVAGLGFNVMSAAIQPLGLTQSITRIGAQWVAKGAMQYLAGPIAAIESVHEQSEFMANRARTRFRELNELRNKVQGASTTREAINGSAYWLMMQFQQMVDIPTWLGAYEKAIADGNADERARALADQAVIDAQGSGMVKDQSAIERGGPAQKLFTVFYSFMNTALNLGVASKMAPGSKAKFAADMLMLYTVPAILGVLLKDALTPGDAGDDDWKKLTRKLIGEQIGYLMGLMVVTREFSEAGKTMAGVTDRPRDYSGPAGVRVVADAAQVAKQVKQGELDDSFRKAAINLIGGLAALPSAQINRTITGAKALKEGKTANPAALLFGYQEQR